MNISLRIITAFTLSLCIAPVSAHESQYLGNEAVLVSQGETKVMFDPLFHNGYGQYQLVPDELRAAMMSGIAPFDGVDAIFISHAHGDHFDADDVVTYLNQRKQVRLVAPLQAVEAMRKSVGWDAELALRITPVNLDYGDPPKEFRIDKITATAVRIAHAGWPAPARVSVQNMVYRLKLGEDATVMHLGDADANPAHYSHYAAHWEESRTDTVFTPYWFFLRPGGEEILHQQLNVEKAIGVHVPKNVPENLKASGADYFSVPGELRSSE